MPKKAKARRDGVYTRKDRPGQFWGSWKDELGVRRRRQFHVHTMQQAKDALRAEKEKVELIKAGKQPVTQDSFKMFAGEFLEHQRKRISDQVVKGKISAAEYERRRGIVEKHLEPHFKAMKLAAITRVDVNAFLETRRGKVADATLIKEANTLKRMFSIAIEIGKLKDNPVVGADVPQAAEGRNRWLKPEELLRLLQTCPLWLRPIAGLAVALGTRRGEQLALRWSDVDLEQGAIRLVRKTKNGKSRIAPINDLALDVLNSLEGDRNSSDLLFPDVTPGQVSVEFRRAVKRAKIDDFSLHDLRHCYGSQLVMNGATLYDVQKLLGHSDPRMTMRYAHLSAEHLVRAAQRLNGVYAMPALPTATERIAAD
jgi:integrase